MRTTKPIYTSLIEGKRQCLPLSSLSTPQMGVLTYPKYLFLVLLEAGFAYSQETYTNGIEFIHTQDDELKILMSFDQNNEWHHLVCYKHSKWTYTYKSDVNYDEAGTKVLELIRSAYKSWHMI